MSTPRLHRMRTTSGDGLRHFSLTSTTAPAERQALMSSWAEIGWRVGNLAAGAGALYLADSFGWHAAYLCMAALMAPGMAAALLAQAEHEARAQGLRALRVDTNSENAATQRLFPKLGYRFAGEIGLAFRPGLRFFCYEKRLG